MRTFIVNVLSLLSALAVIGVLGTADAVDQGAITLAQDLTQTAVFTALALGFGVSAWALNRRK